MPHRSLTKKKNSSLCHAGPPTHTKNPPVPAYHAEAACVVLPPGLPHPPSGGVFGNAAGVSLWVWKNYRAAAAAPPASAAAALDAAFVCLRALQEQRRMEVCSSEAVTRGVRVEATSAPVARLPPGPGARSDSDAGRWLFTYRLRITNAGCRREGEDGAPADKVQLLTRGWEVRDAGGALHARVPAGSAGVVGCTPILAPPPANGGGGEAFEYYSSTDLPTPVGTMAGAFGMAVLTGAGGRVDAAVAPFALRADGTGG